VNKQKIVKAKRIIPIFRLSNFYVVTDGLTKEDLIILEGIQSLREGDKIEIKMIPMPTFS
jgi:membrane fusion protein (multidrug efflux system)